MASAASQSIFLCFGIILLLQTVTAITNQEMQACDALWRNNFEISGVRGGVLNLSRCCDELKLDQVIITCTADRSAITEMCATLFFLFLFRVLFVLTRFHQPRFISSSATPTVNIEFEEFQLFHQLQTLTMQVKNVRLRDIGTCFPTGLDRLPNLTSLYVLVRYHLCFSRYSLTSARQSIAQDISTVFMLAPE
jgi:hypothetical protein